MHLEGAEVLWPEGLGAGTLGVSDGRICDARCGRAVDLGGYVILPGIVDAHGDGFERHLAPRRGAMKDMAGGLIATESELAGNGITTAVLAQFYSWEGGLRAPDFAEAMLTALAAVQGRIVSDLHAQLRFETLMFDDYATFENMVARHKVENVVFNDHVQHARLAAGKLPKRLNGTALKSGRSPETLLRLMQELHGRLDALPGMIDGLAARLRARGVRLGSHDDATAQEREAWAARGVRIAEFPETRVAAEAARAGGDAIVLGAPNVMRGGSHNGNVPAHELIAMGLCDALASDYHYPSMRGAALFLVDAGVCDLPTAWGLISAGPAQLLGLEDRGVLVPGKRADFVVLKAETMQLAATVCNGRFSYLSGDVGERFF